ncbi:MAG: efflux RND transporter periplasmic adaptor subunit [Polyangiaceae bacterium]|nr:efflux RND transporter periplasmic adaptor subunit [Polyangiaceae bacterium]
MLEAPESAISEVRVRSAGFVEQVAPIETGAKVKAGEALLWVYSPDILRTQQELLTARALSSGGAPAVHDDAEMVDAAKTRLELLGVGRGVSNQVLAKGKSVRAIPVSAPKTGIVTARNVSLGAYVTPETMLFQITDLSTLWVSATAETADVALLAPKTRARFESRRGTAIDVEALLVEPRVAARTRTATVRFLAKNDDASLLPGDIGEVVVPTTDEEQVVVPRDAVVDTGAQTYVFVEKSPGRFTPRAITAGPIVGNDRIVKSGVEPGEAIVVRGAFLLDSESRLQGALAPSMDKAP